MPKRPTANDLASLRVPIDVRLSPDGRFACYVVKENAPGLAGYRTALWLAPVELDAQPWTDPELCREMSPLTYAADIEAPLLIQHAEQDLRCPITQAEQLFSVFRSLKRPVRLMRVPRGEPRTDSKRHALPAHREHRTDQ